MAGNCQQLIVFDDAIAEKEKIRWTTTRYREMELARLKLAKLKEVKPRDLGPPVVTSVGDQLLTGSFVSNAYGRRHSLSNSTAYLYTQQSTKKAFNSLLQAAL